MNDQSMQAIALTTNGISTAMVLLVNCLKNTGALDDGRFENALKSTINSPGAASDRLDYQVLANILLRLERKPPPELRVIPGGKSEAD
jgi:hypothetical protein